MKYQELTSKRLRFLPWTENFAQAWTPFFQDKSATAYLGIDRNLEPGEAAKAWIGKQLNRYEAKEFGHLALFDWQEEKLIGSAGILLREIEGQLYHEIAYSILPYYWGRGYAGEAAKVLIQYAENKIPGAKLISIIHTDNKASEQVAKKIGFTKVEEREYLGFPVFIYGKLLD